jgi:hypothetical protein
MLSSLSINKTRKGDEYPPPFAKEHLYKYNPNTVKYHTKPQSDEERLLNLLKAFWGFGFEFFVAS